MITPSGTIRLFAVTTFALIATIFLPNPSAAAEHRDGTTRRGDASRLKETQIPMENVRYHGQRPSPTRSRSLVARAATGRVLGEVPPAPLDGSLVKGNLQQVAYHGAGCSDCGPVCDCGAEVSCGVEVGCGIEVLGPTCGVEGCTECGEAACGIEEVFVDGPGCGLEAVSDCGCDACVGNGGYRADCIPLFLPLLRVNWREYDFFAGMHGFKGPLNTVSINAANNAIRSGSGSFGYHQGFNHGTSMRRWIGVSAGWQIGLRATQSNLSGAGFTEDVRQQIFLTTGWYRRVDYGLQYGVAVDYMNDDWYFQGDLTQLRVDLGWQTGTCHSFGFQLMAALDSDTSTSAVADGAGNLITSTIEFEATDQYRFYYRRAMRNGNAWNSFAGWTDNDDGLLGSNIWVGLSPRLSLQTGGTYLIPREGDSSGGDREEGWNVGMTLVFHPGFCRGGRHSYNRPLFDVADNGTFMVDRR